MLALGLSACNRTPTSLLFDLSLHEELRIVELQGDAEDGTPVFETIATALPEDRQSGTIAVLLPDDAPASFDVTVRGLTVDRSAETSWTGHLDTEATPSISDEELARAKTIFFQNDKDENGSIDRSELQWMLKELG